MTTWLLLRWDALRGSLWFVPANGLLGALLLALAMLKLDATARIERIIGLEWAITTGPAARSTLSTMAGAVVTVTGVVFSITMLTLAQTSVQFGSRLLRSFMNHNIAQITLAVFLATSLYCFTILRAVREVNGGDVFVPHLSVGLGLLLGLASLAMFVFFIHHVSRSIQVQTVVRTVASELDDAIERLFPEKIGSPTHPDDETNAASPSVDEKDANIVEAQHEGYAQAVDGETLMELAVEHDLVIRLLRRPGHFIAVGMPIAAIYNLKSADDELVERVGGCFLTGVRRTPRQDVVCAIQELVEVAVRALSPGINDPHTAITCIDYLGAALSRLAEREMPASHRRDKAGVVRVIVQPLTFADALNAAFDEIRQYGRDSTAVVLRLVDAHETIARKVSTQKDRDAVLRQAVMVERASEEALPEKFDRADVRQRLRELRNLLGVDTSSGQGGRSDHS